MAFQKGKSGNPAGRPPGPNKSTARLRKAILEAATSAGGERKLVGYLEWLALNEPASFVPLLGKLLPRDVNVTEYGERLVRVIDHTGAGPVVHDVTAEPVQIPAELDG